MITTKKPRERAYLVGVLLPGATQDLVREQMSELAELARTAGAEVVGTDLQRRAEIEPSHFIGAGKVDTLREMVLEGAFDMLVCNEDLSPRQQRNLESSLKVRVFDRTEVILEIFALHARTHEGRLQVEAARLHHLLPRLIGSYSYDRQVGGMRGGVGARGGPGEQQIETERRRIRKRIRDLDREIEQVRGQRHQQRTGRRRAELQTAAIVGYTNAGKSTLLNALTGASVRAEHKLFATLDPTTRRLDLPTGRQVLLTDTVGFIQKLPTDLVAAFRATLEEVTVVAAVAERYPGVVPISAINRGGFGPLLEAIDEASRGETVSLELLVPYGSEGVLASLRRIGGVERTEYDDRGTRAWGWAPRHAAARFAPYSAATVAAAAVSGTSGSRRGRRRPG
ncbi:MAG: GTPase HflX [Chloroflexi bacterium]|nr:MAG: GTPase HflX [Chloroflexota bacterium]